MRTIRVLRPLKSINAIESMRKLVASLKKSIPALVNVVFFLVFIFILFGIMGTANYSGALYARCRISETPITVGDHLEWPHV